MDNNDYHLLRSTAESVVAIAPFPMKSIPLLSRIAAAMFGGYALAALTSVVAATLGSTLIKVAAFSYAVRQAFAGASRSAREEGRR